MNIKNVMPNKRNQSQEITKCVIPLTRNVQNRQTHRVRKLSSSCLGLEVMIKKYEISSWGHENILELVMMVAQLCELTKNH